MSIYWTETKHKILESLAGTMNMIYNHPNVVINEKHLCFYESEIETRCTQEPHKTELVVEFFGF